jgi:hypothetical protein
MAKIKLAKIKHRHYGAQWPKYHDAKISQFTVVPNVLLFEKYFKTIVRYIMSRNR